MVGHEKIDDENFITLWTNGTPQRCSIGTNLIHISSALISDNGDVYVAGNEIIDGVSTATLWTNGTPQRFGECVNCSYDVSVFVSGNKVYVVAANKLWIDNVEQNLNLEGHGDSLSDVYVVGNNVYAVGSKGMNERRDIFLPPFTLLTIDFICVAAVWTNNGVQKLTDEIDEIVKEDVERMKEYGQELPPNLRHHYAHWLQCIYVSDNKEVYTAGTVYIGAANVATLLWKDGNIKYRLEGEGMPYSIFVAGNNDVYVAGESYNSNNRDEDRAILWFNGKATPLGNNRSGARHVVVSNNKVYVAGNERVRDKGVATLWTDGTPQYLTDNQSTAYYVVVK